MIFCQICDDCGCILCDGSYEDREEQTFAEPDPEEE